MTQQQSYLVLKEENETRTVTLFSTLETFLGRSPECTVILTDERASRKHAVIHYQKGQWFITDLRSRNGTLVNDQVIDKPTLLVEGDSIRIGHCKMAFFYDSPEENAWEDASEGTGVFGISEAMGAAPSDSIFDPEEIVERRRQTSFLQFPDKTSTARVTRTGYDAADLCQLAYQLGKSESLAEASQLTLEGLLNATDADAAGLWLLPQEVKSSFRVSQLRLVAHVEPEELEYTHISESLAKTVITGREAVLIDERKNADQEATVVPDGTVVPRGQKKLIPFHTLAAPIRYENNILGLIHIYTGTEHHHFTPDDLEYTLAVADTLGTALSHLTREKELAANLSDARQENMLLREQLNRETEIVGVSAAMRQVATQVRRASEGKATLLIYGESGVGKELIARAAHFTGPRKDRPLICLNCAAISEHLLASELFGHEKGAFTGATERKIGKFEAANHGTLFLDEIGEMSPALQAKFLRVLEGAPFERVGGNTPIKVDVRVVAATNRNLEQEVVEKRFRHDLFFRLRVLEIMVPPLRKRKDDIPVLARHFLEKFCKETGRRIKGFSDKATKILMEHRWPGNVRELKNTIERAVLLGSGEWIEEGDLALSVLRTMGNTNLNMIISPDHFEPMSLEDMEKQLIENTLTYCDWNKSNVARILGIERTTLDRKIKRYGLKNA